ncbi:MAG: hypothetical protein CFE25_05740 [Chitinophagaceae bacterium BSSC1]|nr:MAG: hypothetical protein CFE25_05740 [Chitinophagaceae bacterium BSSC1]
MNAFKPPLIDKTLQIFSTYNNELEPIRLYFAYFQIIPNIKRIRDLQGEKFRAWTETKYAHLLESSHLSEYYDHASKRFDLDDQYFIMPEGIVLRIDKNRVSIYYKPSTSAIAEALAKEALKFKKKAVTNQSIKMVANGTEGLETYSIKIKKPSLDLNLHYNEDLAEFHSRNLKNLKKQEKSGLYLFYGLPGTGKSTYIRYLIRSINKEVIFIPPGLAGIFDSPAITKFLLSNRNTVFVIEDAEELLVSRDLNKNSSVSMLLNLTDGLLGETLGIQIIATFNTDLNNIDKALLRKGRLLGMYEFKSLSINRSTTLLEKRGIKPAMVHQPMTLAEIFNKEQIDYQYQKANRPAIGFLSNKT